MDSQILIPIHSRLIFTIAYYISNLFHTNQMKKSQVSIWRHFLLRILDLPKSFLFEAIVLSFMYLAVRHCALGSKETRTRRD